MESNKIIDVSAKLIAAGDLAGEPLRMPAIQLALELATFGEEQVGADIDHDGYRSMAEKLGAAAIILNVLGTFSAYI